MARATQGGVVLNRDDPLVSRIGEALPAEVECRYFGSGRDVKHLFPDDRHLYKTDPEPSTEIAEPDGDADVELTGLSGKSATYSFAGEVQPPVDLEIDGVHNALNGAAALGIVRMVLRDRAVSDLLLKALAGVGPAFGRGESIDIDGSPLEIVLVKNPPASASRCVPTPRVTPRR